MKTPRKFPIILVNLTDQPSPELYLLNPALRSIKSIIRELNTTKMFLVPDKTTE